MTTPLPATGVVQLPDGRLLLAGAAAALHRWLDDQLLGMARAAGAQEHRFPASIDRATLEQAGYFDAFPHGATALCSPAPCGEEAPYLLNPAVCYHAYSLHAGRQLAEPVLLTARQSCFREADREAGSPARLWEFTMREVVFLGPSAWVREQRAAWSARIEAWTAELGLSGRLVPATDPFFGAPGRGRRLLQQLKDLKFELQLDVGGGGGGDGGGEGPVAAASFNLHEDFFGSRFGIGCGGAPAHSGCAAFGLERWTLAWLARHGERAAAVISGISGVSGAAGVSGTSGTAGTAG